MNSVAKLALKFGGLTLSALLTMSLFLDLFGNEAYGWIMALAALALFEGGAMAWSHILGDAQQGQRTIAYFAVWFCIATSIISSGTQIIRSTKVWMPEADMGFWSLIIIVAALAVNVICIFLYEQSDPGTSENNRALNREARVAREQEKIYDSIMGDVISKMKHQKADIAIKVSSTLSDEYISDIKQTMLRLTLGGDSSQPKLPAPTETTTKTATEPAVESAHTPAAA